MRRKVPTGWADCPVGGRLLYKFMPIKTPLGEFYDNKVEPLKRFHPIDILKLAEREDVEIGLLIDLTNTDKYYSDEEICGLGCKYEKLKCLGNGRVPTPEHVGTTLNIIDDHIKQNLNGCIAIHCTYGFNRSGFIIVAYLVERMNIPVEEAIARFAECRPPGIYRYGYIRELYKRYGDPDNIPPVPTQPLWL